MAVTAAADLRPDFAFGLRAAQGAHLDRRPLMARLCQKETRLFFFGRGEEHRIERLKTPPIFPVQHRKIFDIRSAIGAIMTIEQGRASHTGYTAGTLEQSGALAR